MKLNKRLQVIASMIETDKVIYDVGCDHGLISINQALKYKQKSYAIDISPNCIEVLDKKVKRLNLDNLIFPICNNGVNNINIENNACLILSGLGSNTIINIVTNVENIDSIIIQSNNDLVYLRASMAKLGYEIIDEEVIYDRKIYYVVMKFKKGRCKYNEDDLYLGPILKTKKTSIDYYSYLFNKNAKIMAKIPDYQNKLKRLKLENKWLEDILKD